MPAQQYPKKTFWRHVRDFLETPVPMGFVLVTFSGLVFANIIITFYLCEDMITDLVLKPRRESILRQFIL